MKTTTLSVLSCFLPLISAHCIWQRVSVDGADKGLLNGLRAPGNNNPVQSVSSNDIICGAGGSTSSVVISAAAGSRIGAQYQHVIGGPQGSNDADNPIASSHKGPIIVYMAKVSNAASTGTSGLSWFKVAQEGLNNGRWGVDTSIAANGWWYFTLPSCLAPGQYLMRWELIALHSAYTSGQAQFYISCAQIQVTGSGSYTPGSTVSFPGAYKSNDPGIQLNIYSGDVPNNGGKPYTIPGPSVMTCGSGGDPGTTLRTTTTAAGQTTARTTARATTTPSSGGSGAPLYGQCGGNGWTGPTTCASGTCKANGEWYSQCVP